MFEEFVRLGKWWLPNRPEGVVPGKLNFSPRTGATLELIGSFYDSQFEEIGQTKDIIPLDENFTLGDSNITEGVELQFIKPEETIILGLLDNNEEITLYKCYGRIKNFELFKGRPTLSFHADYIFRKIHFQNEQDIKFKSFSIQYSYLEQWIAKSGIQVFLAQDENKIWISYKPPSNIYLTKINELDLSITFSPIYINPFDIYVGATYYKANIEQKTYLTIQNPSNKSLSECIDILLQFRDLLSFAMTKPASVISITGNIDIIYSNPVRQDNGTLILEEEVREDKVTILFSLWNDENNSEIERSTHEMLFIFSDVENSLGDIFEAWINKRETYESVFDLLMTTMYTPNLYLHYGFLNVIQALEVYHTNKFEGIYQDKKVYEKGIYKKFLDVLNNFPSESNDNENGISDEFRNALKGKLKSQTRFTLETRLKEILNDIFFLLPKNFIGSIEDRESFARRASETRNALTHHDKKKRDRAAKGQELLQLFYTLTVILKICLLRELNLVDDSIKTLIERNRAYHKEWRSSPK
jgi:hypothetical protein